MPWRTKVEAYNITNRSLLMPIDDTKRSLDTSGSLLTGWTVDVPWTTKVEAYDITNESDRKRCEDQLKLNHPLLGIATNQCIKVVPDEPCPPSWVNDTRSDPLQKHFYKAFVYSVPSATKPPNSLGIWTQSLNGRVGPQEDDASYRVFLAISDGSTSNNNQVQFLKKNLWLDKFTREVQSTSKF